MKTILQLMEAPGTLRFVDDQRGCPTFCADLAVVVRRLAVDRRPGVYHATNQGGPVSWFEFARDVVAAAGRDAGRVEPISTAELQPPRPARRPANSALDNAALRLAGLPLLPHRDDGLKRLVAQLTG